MSTCNISYALFYPHVLCYPVLREHPKQRASWDSWEFSALDDADSWKKQVINSLVLYVGISNDIIHWLQSEKSRFIEQTEIISILDVGRRICWMRVN